MTLALDLIMAEFTLAAKFATPGHKVFAQLLLLSLPLPLHTMAILALVAKLAIALLEVIAQLLLLQKWLWLSTKW